MPDHSHASHDHAGNDHVGHDHVGHDRAGHDHADHGHSHAGHGGLGHSHAPEHFGTAFAAAIALNALIVVAELVGGVTSGSVALLSDSAHNLSDVLGLLAAFVAHRLSRRPPSSRYTYGLGGTSILAALGNAVLLLVVSGALGLEAIQRLMHPAPLAAGAVMAVAGGAIVVNGLSAWLLAPGESGDLNVRAAVAHLAADAAVAAGVLVAAALVALTGWRWIDPALSLAINLLIVATTWRLLREAVSMSLAAVPRNVRADAVRDYLAALPGVDALHDLHIWPMSTSETALTAHLVMPGGHPGDAFLMECCRALHAKHNIGHATLQVETGVDTACALASETVV